MDVEESKEDSVTNESGVVAEKVLHLGLLVFQPNLH